MLKNVLIVVDKLEESVTFYKDLFGLQVLLWQEGNVILSEGLVLQEQELWKREIQDDAVPFHNRALLYFETYDLDSLIENYESGRYPVRYVTPCKELESGQRMARFYDPSGNLIEVRTAGGGRA